jgi:hypothetical protein
MPQIDEVIDQQPSSGAAVAIHQIGFEAIDAAIDQHTRHLQLLQQCKAFPLARGRSNDHAVDPALDKQVQVVCFLGGILVGIAQNGTIIILGRSVFNTPRHRGPKGIGNVRHDQAPCTGSETSTGCWDVVQVIDGLERAREYRQLRHSPRDNTGNRNGATPASFAVPNVSHPTGFSSRRFGTDNMVTVRACELNQKSSRNLYYWIKRPGLKLKF